MDLVRRRDSGYVHIMGRKGITLCRATREPGQNWVRAALVPGNGNRMCIICNRIQKLEDGVRPPKEIL
jgi:hypothetical protein